MLANVQRPKPEGIGMAPEIEARFQHLRNLLKYLPVSLPLEPAETSYSFGLSQDDIDEEGLYYALNRNLEVCFQTHQLGRNQTLVFSERGLRLEQGLVGVLRQVLRDSPCDR